MLSKFETKSNRVKGIAFHPKRPWVLASLHTGSVQLWDYKMGTLVDKFDEHEGPVRGVAFHSTQPLFVTGGDDHKIKVWNWKQRKCLFTLNGHMDYIRTVSFHHEHPWIISASDDQTIRIWNWQSRNCIAVITGHNHYVMSAFFHPRDNLIVSASMDQTIRIWDFEGLAKKHTTAQKPSFHDPHDYQQKMSGSGFGSHGNQQDMFSNPDVIVKHLIEGHDRGCNWASFHPTLPLIVSASDDRQVKLWRMNESRAWEVDTCRGHFNNVSCAIFHPRSEIILSNGEDKTIRVWDMAKRTTINVFKRDHDRFWIIAAHPELNLFAAGHDNGLIVFKLERERPAFANNNDAVYYVKDKFVRVHDFASGSDMPILTINKNGTNGLPRSLSYNPTEQAVLLCYSKSSSYELYHLPKTNSLQPHDAGSDFKTGAGQSAVFVARNRFAVLDKQTETVYIKDLRNEITKQFKGPSGISDIFYAGMKNILFMTPTSVVLYDTELKTDVGEINVSGVRHAIWSNDMSMVALLSKHSIVIANKKLEQLAQIHETIKVKSGAWDDQGIFVYSTLNHVKYALPQGDNGIIKTLEHPVYISRVKGNTIFCLDREGQVKKITFDPTEYLFKLALVKREYDRVMHIIRTSNLIGQSVIAYLQKKGYSEIALFFVKDPKTRFDLAIECGNLDIAVETAKTLDRQEIWQELGVAALNQGNHQVVEMCYQKTKQFDRLSFLYVTIGHVDKLKKMLKIAEMRNDPMSKYHNAMFLGDVEEQIKVLKEAGHMPLAYLTAKTYSLNEEAEAILAAAGITNPPPTPLNSSLLKPPTPILKHHNENWPTLAVKTGPSATSMFDVKANLNAAPTSAGRFPAGNADLSNSKTTNGMATPAGESATSAWGDDLDLDFKSDPNSPANAAGEDAAAAGGGWGFDDALNVNDLSPLKEAGTTSSNTFIMPTQGTQITDIWCRNSGLAADHIAAGHFESAMQLLHRQAGVVNFAPLKPLFLQIVGSTKACQQVNAPLPSITLPLFRRWEEDNNKVLPFICIRLDPLMTKLQEAYQLTTVGRFADTVPLMKIILKNLLFVVTTSSEESEKVEKLLNQTRHYIIALSMEMHRRELNPESDLKRVAELAAYFTHFELIPEHLILTLRSAMSVSYRMKNLGYASLFARRLLEMNPDPQVANQAKALQQRCDLTPTDQVPLDYDQYNPFDVCALTYTPILKCAAHVKCPFCQSVFQPECKGKLCPTCEVSQIGLPATGFKTSI